MLVRTLYRLIALFLVAVASLTNIRLYVPSAEDYWAGQRASDAMLQLNFLRDALRQGTGEQMQAVFPEGYFFLHVLYGLAWVQLGLITPDVRQQAATEATWALDQLASSQGRAVFSSSLNPPYGVFYAGWSNWLRGGILRLQQPDQRDPQRAKQYQEECQTLNAAFLESMQQRQNPFLSAYSGQAWPVDSVVAIAALHLHDQLFAPEFESTIVQWKQLARQKIDVHTRLLPHRVDPTSGSALETARGSSQSIIQRFLPEIDASWANGEYASFPRQFLGAWLEVPGIREYPDGIDGIGDVDSGPLIGGLSASATVVTLGTAQLHSDQELSGAFVHLAESIGMPLQVGRTKRYMLGLLPIGDAFLVWSQTAHPLATASISPQSYPPVVNSQWRLGIHIFSAVVCLVILIPEILWCRNKKRRTR